MVRVLLLITLGFGCRGGIEFRSRAASVSYNRDIRALLSDHCYACHGPDEKTRKAGLRLDLEAEAVKALKSGHHAIVPGDPSKSTLVERILQTDPNEIMPPPELKKPLSAAQIELLRRWIAEGARYEGHWAYVAPERPEPPSVRATGWPRNDVDAFVLAKLEKEGLRPTPEATKEKLLRRVTLDLTGLPPTVEEIDAYLADPDAKAYEKVVDRLLASPHYGERMAQQWLDLARYGETQGYHHDRHRDQWHWRDWVIKAFNDNQPYDAFTVEQLAGDLLPNPTREQLIATGFHRNEMTTSEGGALPEEYIVKYAVGRVDTTARVWLGTSMACAECHDHKYDPIKQKEFYEFFSFFFDTPENGLDAEELNPSPRITLETPEQQSRLRQLDQEVSTLETAESLVLDAPRPAWDEAQATWESTQRQAAVTQWQTPRLERATVLTSSGSLNPEADGSVKFGSPNAPRRTTYELGLKAEPGRWSGVRLEAIPDAALPGRGAGTGREGEFVLTGFEAEIRSVDPAKEVFPDDPPVPGTWSSVGPFGANSAAEAYTKEFGPEKGVDLGATFEDGRKRWQEHSEWRDEEDQRFDGRFATHYLTRVLTVREARIVEAVVKADAGLRVWLNGRAVLAKPSSEALGKGEERIRLWLRPGENRLLAKVSNGEGAASFRLRLQPGVVTQAPLNWVAAIDDGHAGEHRAAGLIDTQDSTGWSLGTNATSARAAYLRTPEEFGFKAGTEITVRLHFGGNRPEALLGRFRLAVSAASSAALAEFMELPEAVRMAMLQPPEASESAAAKRQEVRRHYRVRHVPEARQTQQLLAAKRKERDDFRNSWPTAMVMKAATPMRESHFLVRGQYFNQGEKVSPGVPKSLFATWDSSWPSNRLGLAKWLTHPRHPLTARVAVNQYWQRYFGAGLVKTAEDFGSQGEYPSDPALLDWLATEFIRSGWNVKAMQRLLVTSATYRQDSVVTREQLERDPENRWLSRGPRFRLDAENVRDVAMAVSGLLNRKVGGPSVFPFQPPGLWGQVAFEGTRDYVQSEGDENYRRGLYTYWRRSIPYAAFTVFDAPSREVCVIRRPRTNTPLQALALMNDPVYVEAARAFGYRVMTQGGRTVDERLTYAFRVALGRKPSDRERALLTAACEREMKQFAENRAAANQLIHVGASKPPIDVDVAELAAWTVLANTLLNLDETITKG